MKESTQEARRRASAKYDAKHAKQVHMKLYDVTDQDIIDHLATVGNIQGYLKELIRKDIENAPH